MAEESRFKAKLIREIKQQFPGAVVLKTNAAHMQGIPDNLILYGPKWAMFEAKDDESSSHRPNQDYYVDFFNEMSYATFVYPQNKEVFLHELQQALRLDRRARILRS